MAFEKLFPEDDRIEKIRLLFSLGITLALADYLKNENTLLKRDYGKPPEAQGAIRQFDGKVILDEPSELFYRSYDEPILDWTVTQEFLQLPRKEFIDDLRLLIDIEIYNASDIYEHYYSDYMHECGITDEQDEGDIDDDTISFTQYCQTNSYQSVFLEAILELLYLVKDTSAIDEVEALLQLHPKISVACNFHLINGDFLVHYLAADVPRFANLFIQGKVAPPAAEILATGFEALLYSRRDLRPQTLAAMESVLQAWIDTPEDSPLLDREIISFTCQKWQMPLVVCHQDLHLKLHQKNYILSSLCPSAQLIINRFMFNQITLSSYFNPRVFEHKSPQSDNHFDRAEPKPIKPALKTVNFLQDPYYDTASPNKKEPPKLIFRPKNS